MAHKQVLFRSAAREKILHGASALADAVRVTLGPKSKSVLIEKKWGKPIVCNDGVTIAKEFDLEDPEADLTLLSKPSIVTQVARFQTTSPLDGLAKVEKLANTLSPICMRLTQEESSSL